MLLRFRSSPSKYHALKRLFSEMTRMSSKTTLAIMSPAVYRNREERALAIKQVEAFQKEYFANKREYESLSWFDNLLYRKTLNNQRRYLANHHRNMADALYYLNLNSRNF